MYFHFVYYSKKQHSSNYGTICPYAYLTSQVGRKEIKYFIQNISFDSRHQEHSSFKKLLSAWIIQDRNRKVNLMEIPSQGSDNLHQGWKLTKIFKCDCYKNEPFKKLMGENNVQWL